MTDEERREMMRKNYAVQLASMGYGPDGMGLPEKKTNNGWTSVKDGLPKLERTESADDNSGSWQLSRPVFVYLSEHNGCFIEEEDIHIAIAVYYKDNNRETSQKESWLMNRETPIGDIVTHWRPLLEGPEEQSHETD